MKPIVATRLAGAPCAIPVMVCPLGQPPAHRAPLPASTPPTNSSATLKDSDPCASASRPPSASVGVQPPDRTAATAPPTGMPMTKASRHVSAYSRARKNDRREPRAHAVPYAVETPSALPVTHASNATTTPIAGPATHHGHGVTKMASRMRWYLLLVPAPRRDPAHQVEHLCVARALEEARRGRGPLPGTTVDHERSVRHFGHALGELVEREVHAPGNRGLRVLGRRPDVDQGRPGCGSRGELPDS